MSSSRLKEAFDCITDDDVTADSILEEAKGGMKRKKTRHAAPLYSIVAVCALCILATGGTAYAIAHADFFGAAWGTHGYGRTQTLTVKGGSETYTYSRSFGDGTAPEGMQDHVLDIGMSVEGNGYTLTLESMAADSNGCGAVTFTLSNPNGVSYYKPAAEEGMLVLNSGEGPERTIGISMMFRDDWADTRCMINKDESTETSVRGVMYFASPNGSEDYSTDIYWTINWSTGDRPEDQHEASTDAFKVSDYIEAATFTCDSSTVELSPFSVRNHIEDIGYSAVADKIVLRLKDGTERVIVDDGVFNSILGYIQADGSEVDVMSELIDPSQVEQVVIEGTKAASDNSGKQEAFSLTFS